MELIDKLPFQGAHLIGYMMTQGDALGWVIKGLQPEDCDNVKDINCEIRT